MDLVALAGPVSHFPSQTSGTIRITSFLLLLVGVSPRFMGWAQTLKKLGEASHAVSWWPIKWTELLCRDREGHFLSQTSKTTRFTSFWWLSIGVSLWFGGWTRASKKFRVKLLGRSPDGLLSWLGCFRGVGKPFSKWNRRNGRNYRFFLTFDWC